MDYEKKYNEALERAKMILCNISEGERCNDIETIFPELKESEDERIREKLYCTVLGTPDDSEWFYDFSKESILSYLKKQKKTR